ASAPARPGECAALVPLRTAHGGLRCGRGGCRVGPAVRLSSRAAAGAPRTGARPGGGVPILRCGSPGADANQPAADPAGAVRGAARRQYDADARRSPRSADGLPAAEAGGGRPFAAEGPGAAGADAASTGAAAGAAPPRGAGGVSPVSDAMNILVCYDVNTLT